MFRRVAMIRNFGVFSSFTGGTLSEFAPFNILYGWNYSGKTTLSRLFRCIESGSLHPDYPNANFSLSHEDGNNYEHDFRSPCNVRVFNEDFRKENLLWDDADGFNSILLLGAEQIDARNSLAAKEDERRSCEAVQTKASNEAKKLKDVLSKAETDCAGQIVKELPVGRFDKRNLRPIIDSWNEIIPDALSDAAFSAARAKLSSEQKDTLPDLKVNTRSIESEWLEGVNLLIERIASAGTIASLVERPNVAAWIEDGLHIHKDATYCEFCEGLLPSSRLDALNAHFSTAFEDLKKRVKDSIKALSDRKLDFSGGSYARTAFYTDLQDEQTEAGRALGAARDAFNKALQGLIDNLERKSANPFEIITHSEEVVRLDTLTDAVSRFRTLIKTNNDRTLSFSTERNEATTLLKNHYAAEAMRKVDRFTLLGDISKSEIEEKQAKDRVAELQLEMAQIRADLSNASKGAAAINDALRRFFGKDDLHIEVTNNDKFVLMRGRDVARNLSEGERTAIAFCYFITKLLEQGNDLSNTIVYIDDPISSLDAHHLLHINAFIKTTFYKYDPASNPKHVCLAKQLFVSTHNYEFFHLTWEWMSGQKRQLKAAAYLVERTDANGLISSRIVDCPDSIKLYKSEYLFLYHQLANFLEKPSNDAQVIFNLGNMARRFVEGYLSFKFFEHHKIDLTLSRIIVDPVQCERARKFMHFYSHTLNRAGGIRLPDMSEAQEVLNHILDAVRSHDPIHYGSLEATR